MTLNGVKALILLHFTEFYNFSAYYITVVEDRPISEYRLPLPQNWPTLQRSLSAIAELLVKGYGAKELITEFRNKGWGLRRLNQLLKKLQETGTTALDEAATLKA